MTTTDAYITSLQRAVAGLQIERSELLAMFPHDWRDCKTPGLCATGRAAVTLIGSANAGRRATVGDYRALFPDELNYAKAQRAVAHTRLRYPQPERARRILRAALVWWRSEVARIEGWAR